MSNWTEDDYMDPEDERKADLAKAFARANKAPHGWLDANCRMRPDGLYFDSDGNLYRPATEDEAQHGLNDTWPGDPISVRSPRPSPAGEPI